MLESILTGAVQGITEWLPISSEGSVVLVKTLIFNADYTLPHLVRHALFLHLGTFLAALIYFRKEVWQLIKDTLSYKTQGTSRQNEIRFLIISTAVTGVVGLAMLKLIEESTIAVAGKPLVIAVGIALLITAFLQLATNMGRSYKDESNLSTIDGALLGVAQTLAAIPGVSRSGITVSMLLLRKYDKELSLRLSFLMSLPVVLGGNILLNTDSTFITSKALVALLASFIFGYLTIDLLLKMARRINFGYFVLFFAVLTLFAGWVA